MPKHRTERTPLNAKREYRYLKNRWMFFLKPQLKRKLEQMIQWPTHKAKAAIRRKRFLYLKKRK